MSHTDQQKLAKIYCKRNLKHVLIDDSIIPGMWATKIGYNYFNGTKSDLEDALPSLWLSPTPVTLLVSPRLAKELLA